MDVQRRLKDKHRLQSPGMSIDSKIIIGNWVLPVAGPPIQNGAVAIEAGRILAVGSQDEIPVAHPTMEVQELPATTIIPGLVNAHTHLEFSDLASPLGYHGISLPDWIRIVVQSRYETSPADKRNAISQGLHELVSTGTVAVGEIATPPTNLVADYAASPVHKTIFLEQLTRNLDLLPQRASEAATHLDQTTLSMGLSPHAPYSTHAKLVEQLVDAAIENDAPLAMHLAESRDEIELLESRGGRFVEMLKDFGVWNPDSFSDRDSIDNLIEQLGRHKRSLLIHGNYLTDQQLKRIAELGLTIVFCPRTHAWFGHQPYPLSRMLELGINVAVGTDSRGSNPDLNLLEDMKHIATNHPASTPATILEIGTLNGARALGIQDQFGSLEKGKLAALSQIQSKQQQDSPWWWLTEKSAIAKPVQ